MSFSISLARFFRWRILTLLSNNLYLGSAPSELERLGLKRQKGKWRQTNTYFARLIALIMLY
jgi:hypothetical protein